MNKQQLRNERPDHKTENTYFVDSEGYVWWLFGATDEVILGRRVHFVGDDMRMLPLQQVEYTSFDSWTTGDKIVASSDGGATVNLESVESVESPTITTVSRTIRLIDVARIREVCRTAGIRLAVQCDVETAECIVLRQDANQFVRLLDNELSR
jgi:hypothetical protein